MRILLLALLGLALFSCGKNHDSQIVYVPIDREVKVAQEFEGVFYFDNGSSIELVAAADTDVSILREGQLLTSVNPKNDTFAQHPVFSKNNVEIQNGSLHLSMDLNYTDGNDLEEDVSGSNIRGRRRTDISIEKRVDGGIRLTFTIYSDKLNSNANYIVAVRVFDSI